MPDVSAQQTGQSSAITGGGRKYARESPSQVASSSSRSHTPNTRTPTPHGLGKDTPSRGPSTDSKKQLNRDRTQITEAKKDMIANRGQDMILKPDVMYPPPQRTPPPRPPAHSDPTHRSVGMEKSSKFHPLAPDFTKNINNNLYNTHLSETDKNMKSLTSQVTAVNFTPQSRITMSSIALLDRSSKWNGYTEHSTSRRKHSEDSDESSLSPPLPPLSPGNSDSTDYSTNNKRGQFRNTSRLTPDILDTTPRKEKGKKVKRVPSVTAISKKWTGAEKLKKKKKKSQLSSKC